MMSRAKMGFSVGSKATTCLRALAVGEAQTPVVIRAGGGRVRVQSNDRKFGIASIRAPKVPSLQRNLSQMRLETEGEEMGKLVPLNLKAVHSVHNTFSQGEVVVVNQPDGEHFFGRVETDTPQKNRDGMDEYQVCVDEKGTIRLVPVTEIGKIVSTGEEILQKPRDLTYPPPSRMKGAHVEGMDEYHRMYHESLQNPEKFWSGISEDFHWQQKWHTLSKVNFDHTKGPVSIEWFLGGKTNLAYNCIDRHVLAGKGDKVAFIWEGNDGERKDMTYKQLLEAVCKFANGLKSLGVKKGDLVSLYMPMVLELPVAMLACARIGAVHSVVFAGFSAEALATRLSDSKSKVLITADGSMRGPKLCNFKEIVDTALDHARDMGHSVSHTIMVQRLGASKVDLSKPMPGMVMWDDLVSKASDDCPVEWLDSEDPSFVLYTSGSTGKPKGALHTTAGYLIWAATTFKYVFDYRPGDVYWCTADCGWITGHTYITYGPTANAATQVLFEGVPTHPSPTRCWEIIERHGVTQFYTAPTAVRSLISYGDAPLRSFNLETLRVLGTVGEPISPDAWKWFHTHVGGGQCPVVDTWWQTETGGHMITPLPGVTSLKPGSASLPFFGVEPVVLDAVGNEVDGPCEGFLAIKRSWPGMLRGIFGDQARFESTYFSLVNSQNAVISRDKYIAGDAVRRDEDGFYWITGRIDDVINVSGHRIGTAEVESALSLHPLCTEAAVVGYPHPVKGESIYAFVTLSDGQALTPEIEKQLKQVVRAEIGPFAAPEIIHGAPGLPKTRSGKIMRRILRRIAAAGKATNLGELGDLSTLADPAVVPALISTAKTH